MKYSLKGPCRDCPFRNDKETPFFAAGQRVEDILDGMDTRVFPCHKTTHFDDEGDQIIRENSQACAGALIMMAKSGVSTSIVQVLGRLGMMSLDHLDAESPVYRSPAECVQVHQEFGSRSGQRNVTDETERRHKWWWSYE